jgi:thymidylate kinase
MSKARAKRGRDARDEYDFSNGVRGKYTKRFAECSTVVVLDPDVARRFPDSTAVNEALREFLAGTRAKAFLLRLARRRAKRSKG